MRERSLERQTPNAGIDHQNSVSGYAFHRVDLSCNNQATSVYDDNYCVQEQPPGTPPRYYADGAALRDRGHRDPVSFLFADDRAGVLASEKIPGRDVIPAEA